MQSCPPRARTQLDLEPSTMQAMVPPMLVQTLVENAIKLELLAKLVRAPQVIFTTAYDEHAIRAFEVNALDYLMKPVSPERLAAAVARLTPGSALLSKKQVFVRDGERCWFLQLSDVALLESEGNYTRLHFQGTRALVPWSLNHFEAKLPASEFFRISRKHIVNLMLIESIHPWPNGGYLVRMRGGLEASMSRRQGLRFQRRMSL
ncbi:MAG: response regulator [Acidimicrobiia bacterium]|nr:response regulator [Acidimicrobiia bacterium]